MTLNPNYQTVSGLYQLTKNWAIALPGEFNRRLEEESMVLWRKGVTLWISAYGNDDGMSIEKRLDRDEAGLSKDASHKTRVIEDGVGRLTYRLSEKREDDAVVKAVYATTHADDCQIMIAHYYDDDQDVEQVEELAAAIIYTGDLA